MQAIAPQKQKSYKYKNKRNMNRKLHCLWNVELLFGDTKKKQNKNKEILYRFSRIKIYLKWMKQGF